MIYLGLDIRFKNLMLHAMHKKKQVGLQAEISPNKQALRKTVLRLVADTRLVVFEASNL